MSQSDRFFSIRIAALAHNGSPKEKLSLAQDDAILHFSAFKYPCLSADDYMRANEYLLSRALEGWKEDVQDEEVNSECPIFRDEGGEYCIADDSSRYALACEDLEVRASGSVWGTVADVQRFRAWARNRSRAFARIRTDLFWDAFKGEMSFRRFSIICAIISRLGKKAYTRITVEDIRRMSAGLTNREEFKRFEKGEIEGGQVYTPDQVRTTVRGLTGSLFARFTYNNGETWYAHLAKHPDEASLELAVLRKKARRQGLSKDDAGGSDRAELRAYLDCKKSPNVYKGIAKVIPRSSQGNPKVIPTYIESYREKPERKTKTEKPAERVPADSWDALDALRTFRESDCRNIA